MCCALGIQYTGAQSIETSAGEFLQNLALSYFSVCSWNMELNYWSVCVPKIQGKKAISQQWQPCSPESKFRGNSFWRGILFISLFLSYPCRGRCLWGSPGRHGWCQAVWTRVFILPSMCEVSDSPVRSCLRCLDSFFQAELQCMPGELCPLTEPVHTRAQIPLTCLCC